MGAREGAQHRQRQRIAQATRGPKRADPTLVCRIGQERRKKRRREEPRQWRFKPHAQSRSPWNGGPFASAANTITPVNHPEIRFAFGSSAALTPCWLLPHHI